MKLQRIKKIMTLLVMMAGIAMTGSAQITTKDVSLSKSGQRLQVSASLVLDSLNLKSNSQIFLTPIVSGVDGESVALPTILVTGRGMHYAFERGTMRGLSDFRKKYNIEKEVRRNNGKPQTIDYLASTPLLPWMRNNKVSVTFQYDNCGCGVLEGTGFGQQVDTTFNPARKMHLSFVTPKVTDLPVSIHEGRARVQFEVNRTELHDNVYKCRNGQTIDNREQLKVIYDSLEYALNDPNVEIAKIEITGYASPESPYEHNKTLATGRSKALAEYIGGYAGRKYNISQDVTTFDAVAENWDEFRQQVESSKEISEQQRADLLELIDRPAFTSNDFDAKERELKTNPKFKALYTSKILPEWFPHLRATKFRISTRLRPMSDDKLAEIIKTSPEKMTLNQMMRVANLYSPGSSDFMKVIETSLKYFPDNEEANLNAAAASIASGDFDKAESYLKKVGNQPEAINARAIILTQKGNFEDAHKLLEQISDLPAASENLKLLNE